MRKFLFLFFAGLFLTQAQVNEQTTAKNHENKPKLVVGIVVDQMRYDYLTRFYSKYGEGGFKRIMNDGFNMKNAHYNYIPTYTAVGHTSIYAGTTPTNHGIISNSWYDKYAKEGIYCVDDSNYNTVGTNSDEGKKSPHRLQTTTVTDQVHLGQNNNGKVISVAIKDRSAILPGGHTANGAFWFDGGDQGKWVTSTFYMDKLPSWVAKYNTSGDVDKLMSKPWETYYPIETYTESIADDNPYERKFKGEEKPTFPHDVPNLRKTNKNYSLIKAIPAGNTMTKNFAEAAILGENLGKSEFVDFLAVSFSSTDYVGHQFGVDSKEIEDTYIRLDKDLEEFFNFLDKEVGKGNYTLFLTADHAAVQVPSYLNSLKIPGGYFDDEVFANYVNDITENYFGSREIVENISNFQIFLNAEEVRELKLNKAYVQQVIADEIINFKGVYKSVTAQALQSSSFDYGILDLLQKGYNQKFSGDILFVPTPATISYPKHGSTHGSGYSYDTHVPMIFYGVGINQGTSMNYYPIIDIAPTISTLIGVEYPNGNTGQPISEVLE
ncbi:alkaline phosphatase PafA [Aureivirga sp. CE67]|uniref:alkaline phosphatase PafA n=1 Tax=Aureivirga sp. CE67 TaxID=1788983 RepID=UPI0018CBA631|nr:alkaline phosphatase PafA [Aureivirga sp. CE67]